MKINITPHKRGDGGLLCMPLVRNLPDANKTHTDWEKTTCVVCGSACWKSELHKQILKQEKDAKAVCTMCAIKAGVMKN